MDTKVWWQSKTMWGGIIAVLAGIAGVFGYAVAESDQATLVDGLVAVSTVVGGVLAVIGRIGAKTTVIVTKE